jgi:hypothetical protein
MACSSRLSLSFIYTIKHLHRTAEHAGFHGGRRMISIGELGEGRHVKSILVHSSLKVNTEHSGLQLQSVVMNGQDVSCQQEDGRS